MELQGGEGLQGRAPGRRGAPGRRWGSREARGFRGAGVQRGEELQGGDGAPERRAVVRTHLPDLVVLLALRREADVIQRVPGCELHGRHHARGGAWAGRRVASCVLGEGANELAEASIVATTRVRIIMAVITARLSLEGARWRPGNFATGCRKTSPAELLAGERWRPCWMEEGGG